MFDPITVLSSLIPAISYIGKKLVDKYTGGAPKNAEEVVGIMQAETERLKALKALDSSDNISPWVANIRALQRPIATSLILSIWGIVSVFNLSLTPEMYYIVSNLASCATFYLFGDRTMMYLENKKGK